MQRSSLERPNINVLDTLFTSEAINAMEGAWRCVPAKNNGSIGWERRPFPKNFFWIFFEISETSRSLMNDARDLKLYTKVWIIESHCSVKFQVRESFQSRVMTSGVDRSKKTQRCYEWRERLETSHEWTTHWWTHSSEVSSSRVVSEQSYGLRRKMRNSLKNDIEDLRMHMNDHINECVVHV